MHAAKIVRNLNCRWSSVLRTGTRPIHRSDDATPHVVKDLHVGKTPITAQLWQMRLAQRSCEGGAESAIDRPVLTKTAKDSRLSLRYKFSSDWQLKDLYADHMGNVLIGKLLEDLDALAGNIAITHAEDDLHNRRLAMVTASVDRIVQQKAISITDDLILTGQVVWVGRSSLDVIIELHKAGKDGTDINPDDLLKDSSSRLLSSFFTYVARDRITGKAATVHKLQLETPTEVSLHSERQKVADARKSKQPALARTQQSYEALSQLVESGSAIEDMPALAHPNAVLMKLTALENSFICQPQNVNTSRRVFGGFLMHRAYDLALATCYTFAGCHPIFLEVDKITFRRPVDIGDLVRMKSQVVYTSDGPLRALAMVEVTCQVIRPERASSFVSNKFTFVFGFQERVALRKVLPLTIEEASKLVKGSKAIQAEQDSYMLDF